MRPELAPRPSEYPAPAACWHNVSQRDLDLFGAIVGSRPVLGLRATETSAPITPPPPPALTWPVRLREGLSRHIHGALQRTRESIARLRPGGLDAIVADARRRLVEGLARLAR